MMTLRSGSLGSGLESNIDQMSRGQITPTRPIVLSVLSQTCLVSYDRTKHNSKLFFHIVLIILYIVDVNFVSFERADAALRAHRNHSHSRRLPTARDNFWAVCLMLRSRTVLLVACEVALVFAGVPSRRAR